MFLLLSTRGYVSFALCHLLVVSSSPLRHLFVPSSPPPRHLRVNSLYFITGFSSIIFNVTCMRLLPRLLVKPLLRSFQEVTSLSNLSAYFSQFDHLFLYIDYDMEAIHCCEHCTIAALDWLLFAALSRVFGFFVQHCLIAALCKPQALLSRPRAPSWLSFRSSLVKCLRMICRG